MIGSELAGNAEYLLSRARSELDIASDSNALFRRVAPLFVGIFGVPETGVQMRILHALRFVPRDAKRIVDVGCGSGMLLGALHRRFPTVMLTGIEIDSTSARIAKDVHPYANIIHDDAIDAATKIENQFDCAVCIDVLEHISDEHLPAFLNTLSKLLRPAGRLIIHVPKEEQRRHFKRFSAWSHHDHAREGFSAESLRRELNSNGFEVERVKDTFGYWGSLAWELNMLVAAKPLQGIAFPVLMALTVAGERVPSRRYNGLLFIAKRTA